MHHLTKPQLALVVLAVLYLVSPVDLIPELLTGPLGLTDDVAALTVLISTLALARAKARDAQAPVTVQAQARPVPAR